MIRTIGNLKLAIELNEETGTISYRGTSLALGTTLDLDGDIWKIEKVYPSPFVVGVTNLRVRRVE